jgi:hypothetical protein
VTRTLKCWYRFEMSWLRMPRVLTYTEGNTRDTRFGKGIEGPLESSGRGMWDKFSGREFGRA